MKVKRADFGRVKKARSERGRGIISFRDTDESGLGIGNECLLIKPKTQRTKANEFEMTTDLQESEFSCPCLRELQKRLQRHSRG